tara:strand:+ start:344 stop:802 length:459 start_codon:yes stop_codon:yes gene_type:complete
VKPHSDTLAGIVLLIFCGIALWLTAGFTEVPTILSQNIPPTFFPRLVLMIIAGLSVVLILGGLRSEKNPSAEIPPTVLITALVITVAVAVTDFVGIFPALFLVSVVLPLCWKEQRLHFIVLLALSLPTSIYLIFTIILGVQFPHGLIADAFS